MKAFRIPSVGGALIVMLGGSALLSCSAGHAQSDKSDSELMTAAGGFLINTLNSNSAREQYLSSVARPLRSLDRDADGLDQRDVARARARGEARRRAGLVSALLQYDYNADLKVTRDEIIEYSSAASAEARESEADAQMKRLDTDGDGTATIKEAMARGKDQRRGVEDQATKLLELDAGGDGRLTVNELLEAAGRVFDHFDYNGNGIVDAPETEAIREYQHEIRERQRMIELGCVLPKASEDAQLVAYGVYESDVISTAWVGSYDTETGVIDVTIEPGSRPLYLVLSSYDAMIWRFSGASDRIERVVAGSYETGASARDPDDERPVRSAVAVTGIGKDRLTVVGSGCLRDGWRFRDGERDGPDRIGELVAGRPMDVVASEYGPVRVSLPSGEAKRAERRDLPAPKGFEAEMWAEAVRFSPGGIARIDPKTLVTSQPVGTYDIMPEEFGLAQLLARGALKRAGRDRLLLTREIAHWPSGLAGAHSTNFIVSEGVTPPEGNPGHSCVMSEADATRPNWKRECREGRRNRTR
ncbi:EF-hand domain-containing protein [Erythrobacter sp. THAF29]|uniref:EF-hand domain-containing protein n=1 Tax=Erythrobacter sp. THAF29 TaxID=2587851 RepID=UPI0012691BF1|nr:hypothetical protein [Erythrobacter sp. THAF29]QFT78102.1 EF hand [Erythrobacter sp. THAF29]